jgi:hypothetical protein
VAGTQLPLLADYTILMAFLIAAGVGVLVLGPRVVAAHDRREITWFDAGLKSAVIVVGTNRGATRWVRMVFSMAASDCFSTGTWQSGQ